jgi:hypothetical protein
MIAAIYVTGAYWPKGDLGAQLRRECASSPKAMAALRLTPTATAMKPHLPVRLVSC